MTEETPKSKRKRTIGQRPDGTNGSTKHHIVRIDDPRWQRLQEIAKGIVTSPKPLRVREDSNWQLTEMLRLLADGKLSITVEK